MVDFTPVQIDYNAIINATNAQIAYRTSTLSSSSSLTQNDQLSAQATAELEAGTPPWDSAVEVDTAQLIRQALSITPFISESAAEEALSADEDTPKLFALYDAVERLKALAQGVVDDDVQTSMLNLADKRFAEGLDEIYSFLGEAEFNTVTIVNGEQLTSAQTDVSIERQKYEYVTPVIHEGTSDEAVEAWAGASGFTIDFTNSAGTTPITIDLSSLADEDRSVDAVVALINTELESAGAVTRFEATKIGTVDENGIVEGDDWAFKIAGTQTERLAFSADDAEPAIYLVGSAGEVDNRAGQIAKYTDLGALDPTRTFVQRLEADAPALEEGETIASNAPNSAILATETAADGSVYVLAETEGTIDGQGLRSDSDLALVKYDSTGKIIWTRVLGSTSETEGYALAVSDDGRVAIAGSTNADLTEDAIGGGEDGFVTVYDSTGVEQFTRQSGSMFDDRIEALAFASDGSLYIAGRTEGSVGDATNAGGTDSFIEKLDVNGTALWSRQIGTAENDRITALAVDDSGAVVAASYEDGETVLRRYASDTADADDWTHNLGSGIVRDLVVDGTAVYASGETKLSDFSGGAFAGVAQSDVDAFALRLDVAGGTATDAWFTRFGGDGDQTSPALEVYGDSVYVAGSGATGFGSAVADGERNAYVAKLDASDGVEAWAETLNGRADLSSASGIAIDPTGGSSLDLFGLPSGTANVGDVNSVTDRTAARPGDHFYLAVEGGAQKKITIEAGDTYRDLTFKINAALVLDGVADISSSDGVQSLRITPSDLTKVELFPGDDGQDALSALGLASGVLYQEPYDSSDAESDAPELVALGLDFTSSIIDAESAQKAVEMLEGVERAIRQAYSIATEDPTLANLTENSAATGTVPAYLQAQIANYQAGLDRLGGGTSVIV